ncbi:MAG: DUF481 domain-containing protein [Gemmatimonadota bacterium]|nr:DUF481 domain-containing protein [Gemmatimonadota bacterium]
MTTPSISRRLSALVFMLVALLGPMSPEDSAAQTILNVERLQPGDVTGWHWGLQGELSLSRGNSDYVDALAGVATGHRWSDHWLRLFLGLDYRSETGAAVQNDRYVHVRYNRWLAPRWQTFHFIQIQASRRNLLQRRTLFGSGLRHRLVDGRTTFDLGTGVMHERENLDQGRIVDGHSARARVWRMANLIVGTQRLSESLRLVGVSYIQPAFSDFGDLRTLTDLSLQIALTTQVDLTIHGEWRHDSRPPSGVDRDDFLLSTGFAFTLR